MKLLMGGSPCTHWSIAQKNNRETTAEGIGWELFKNYLIAKEKFKPDFFLYENNKSAAQPIKDQIAHELGVGKDPKVRFTYINSALVSAQNRQRFYVTNFGEIEQPEDRGILLKYILETGTDLTQNRKSYCMTASYDGAVAWNTIERSQRSMVAEPVALNTTTGGKSQCLRASCYKDGIRNMVANDYDKRTCVAEPVNTTKGGKSRTVKAQYYKNGTANFVTNGGFGATAVAESVRVGCYPIKAVSCADGKEYPVYQVLNGQIEIRNRRYDIKLPDGYYIIRKLTVTECCRLQTMPDDYCKVVSATQGYKGLGNGWTAEVIIHQLNYALRDVPRGTHLEVLSMYDGIGTGRYCLDKMGFTNITYKAYEIDKYAMQVANDNYPDIIQCGDAFQLREVDWNYEVME